MAAPYLVKTGLPSLDALLGGGLPPQANVLLYGPPLCGKKPLCMQFIHEGLKRSIPGIFLLTDYGYEDWRRMMFQSGWSLDAFEQSGAVQAIDCYSKQFDPELLDDDIVTYVETPAALSTISLRLDEVQDAILQNSKTHRLAFHSISTLLEAADAQTVFKFMQFVVGKFRRDGATAFYTIEKGMHDEKDVKMIEHLMDGVIEFDKSKISVRGLPGALPGEHEYEITDHGIEIKL